jgi:hypothetical protein
MPKREDSTLVWSDVARAADGFSEELDVLMPSRLAIVSKALASWHNSDSPERNEGSNNGG